MEVSLCTTEELVNELNSRPNFKGFVLFGTQSLRNAGTDEKTNTNYKMCRCNIDKEHLTSLLIQLVDKLNTI